jgi:hypothetical protein
MILGHDLGIEARVCNLLDLYLWRFDPEAGCKILGQLPDHLSALADHDTGFLGVNRHLGAKRGSLQIHSTVSGAAKLLDQILLHPGASRPFGDELSLYRHYCTS